MMQKKSVCVCKSGVWQVVWHDAEEECVCKSGVWQVVWQVVWLP